MPMAHAPAKSKASSSPAHCSWRDCLNQTCQHTTNTAKLLLSGPAGAARVAVQPYRPHSTHQGVAIWMSSQWVKVHRGQTQAPVAAPVPASQSRILR